MQLQQNHELSIEDVCSSNEDFKMVSIKCKSTSYLMVGSFYSVVFFMMMIYFCFSFSKRMSNYFMSTEFNAL